MDKAKNLRVKKFITLIGSLLIGFLMPYLSRMPLAFKYGAAWIWSYMNDTNALIRWNTFHSFSLIPIFICGAVYIFGNVRWIFYIAALAHFAATFFCYFNFEEHPHPDDFLGFIVFPYFIGFIAFGGGIIALFAELFISRRTMKSPVEPKNKNVYV